MKRLRLIIAGSRNFDFGYDFIDHYIRKFDLKPTEVVCGGATGIDNAGKQWADMKDTPVKMFGAEWSKFGRSAGPLRNKQMAEYGDELLLIWSGSSAGSASMLNEMQKQGKTTHQVIVKEVR